MRTTIELPNDLMRTAKAMAAEHGESLKDLVSRAVTNEVRHHPGRQGDRRVKLPLVGANDDGPLINLTNEDIEAIFEAEDAERYGQ